MDAQGRLVTTAGYPVMGIKGEIFISGSDIQVDDQGQIYSNGTVVDRLKIVNFSTPLSKEGDTLFYGENPQIMDNPLVVHGTIEASNVQPLTEMVNMITIMRAYEANQKVIHAIDSTLDKAVNEVGRI